VRCFYHRDYYFPLPESHPFPMDKFWRAEAMIRAAAPDDIRILDAAPAPFEDLRRVHTDAYLEKIRRGELSPLEALGLGLPAGEALLVRSRLETGGTLLAAEAALADGLTANLAGGTHHAHADRGLGYCVLNDVAVAIRAVHARRPSLRILVIDTDAHHGDGTAALFAGDARVFTLSLHGAKNFPFRRSASTLDIELADDCADDAYLAALTAALEQLAANFAPDIVFYLAGADPYRGDRLGRLGLSMAGLQARDAQVLALCEARQWPLAVMMAGGYATPISDTVAIHLNTVRAVLACHHDHR